MATMVTRTRLDTTLYVHCQSFNGTSSLRDDLPFGFRDSSLK